MYRVVKKPTVPRIMVIWLIHEPMIFPTAIPLEVIPSLIRSTAVMFEEISGRDVPIEVIVRHTTNSVIPILRAILLAAFTAMSEAHHRPNIPMNI